MNQATSARHAAMQFWSQLKQDPSPQDDTTTLLEGYAGERLRVGTFVHAPHVLTSDRVAHVHRQAALLTLQLEGQACVEQHGRRCTIAAGDFCLLDLSRPFRLEIGQSMVQTVYLPIAVLRDAVPLIEQASAIALHEHLGSAGFLRALYREIFARAPQLTEPVAGRLFDAIPHMFAAALEGAGPVGEAAPSQLRQHHKQLARRFAREHLSDPGLCVERIAKGIGLSNSYLFELFNDEDVTLMRWVRSERLARCCRELENPAARRKTIAQVAYGWGFGDAAHFSRSFRDAFGMSPRKYRQKALFGDAGKG